MRALIAAGASTFLEAGGGEVLTKLMKRIDPEVRALAVAGPADARDAVAR
jgi:malonyl CoA-acyl carrier protein transacylase